MCVRIETFENKESEQLVRKVLNGNYANTSFAIFNPQGTRMLTRGGRSPSMAMSADRGRTDPSGRENAELIGKLNQISRQYRQTADTKTAELQDFNSLRQALNCASADQRLLIFVNCPKQQRDVVESKLKSIFSDKEIVGKFHLNFFNEKTDSEWARVIEGAKNKPSIVVVRSGQFGLEGRALKQLALDAADAKIKEALLEANEYFAKVEKRKNYEEHVQAGRRQRVYFENEISRKGTSDGGNRRPPRGR